MGEQLRQIDALEAAQQARKADESQLALKADGLRAKLALALAQLGEAEVELGSVSEERS